MTGLERLGEQEVPEAEAGWCRCPVWEPCKCGLAREPWKTSKDKERSATAGGRQTRST